ncbi:hypothetical protein [Campylobacter subantarcticus]|uniref:hypothetical protein n=1 Tax=Campylobacter subantarcticus TaxID=497724 RepID=UPI000A61BB77|nr:hypothetical protein [Campylobacter subantarcticus]
MGENYQDVISYISQKAEFTPKTIIREKIFVYMIKINLKNNDYLKIKTYTEVYFCHD